MPIWKKTTASFILIIKKVNIAGPNHMHFSEEGIILVLRKQRIRGRTCRRYKQRSGWVVGGSGTLHRGGMGLIRQASNYTRVPDWKTEGEHTFLYRLTGAKVTIYLVITLRVGKKKMGIPIKGGVFLVPKL